METGLLQTIGPKNYGLLFWFFLLLITLIDPRGADLDIRYIDLLSWFLGE